MTTNAARLIDAGLTRERAEALGPRLSADLSDHAIAAILARAAPEDLQPSAYFRLLKQRAQAERAATNRTAELDRRLAAGPRTPLDELDARMDRLRRT